MRIPAITACLLVLTQRAWRDTGLCGAVHPTPHFYGMWTAATNAIPSISVQRVRLIRFTCLKAPLICFPISLWKWTRGGIGAVLIIYRFREYTHPSGKTRNCRWPWQSIFAPARRCAISRCVWTTTMADAWQRRRYWSDCQTDTRPILSFRQVRIITRSLWRKRAYWKYKRGKAPAGAYPRKLYEAYI